MQICIFIDDSSFSKFRFIIFLDLVFPLKYSQTKYLQKQQKTILKVMTHVFNQRLIKDWNSLYGLVITSKSLNILTSRLDSFWHEEQ